MSWDVDDNTVDIVLNGYKMKIGEDQFYPVKNQTGSNIAKGVAVRFAGTVGSSGRLLIAPFLADGSLPSTRFMGVTAEAIANGEDGKVLWFGRLRGINTSAFAEGDILYASTTVAGGFQTTVPTAPNNIVEVAAVVTDATNGTIFIRPQFIQSVGSVGAGAGLSIDGDGNIQLGFEDYAGNRTVNVSEWVDPNGYQEFVVRDTGGILYFNISRYTPSSSQIYTNIANTVGLGGGQFSISSEDNDSEIRLIRYNDIAGQSLIFSTADLGSKIVLEDTINSKGLENAGDYESNFTARSLVTKQYVDGISVGGLTFQQTLRIASLKI